MRRLMSLSVWVVALALLCGGAPGRAAGAPLEAYFAERSYGPRERVDLRVYSGPPAVEVRLFRAGGESEATRADDVMKGVRSVGRTRCVARGAAGARCPCGWDAGRAGCTSRACRALAAT